MSQQNLALVQNHAEDIVPVSPLTANVCVTHHETLCKCYAIVACTIIFSGVFSPSIGFLSKSTFWL